MGTLGALRSRKGKRGPGAGPWALILCAGGLLAASMAVTRAETPASLQAETAPDHAALFAEDRFPSATTCAPATRNLREWSVRRTPTRR